MLEGLKALFAGLKLTKGLVYGALSILGTLASIYFLWQGNSDKKAELLIAAEKAKQYKSEISALKKENSEQNHVIMLCELGTKRLKELKEHAETRAKDEANARALDKQKYDILKGVNEKRIKKILASQTCAADVISDDAARLYDDRYKTLQSTRGNRDSDNGKL